MTTPETEAPDPKAAGLAEAVQGQDLKVVLALLRNHCTQRAADAVKAADETSDAVPMYRYQGRQAAWMEMERLLTTVGALKGG